VQLSYAGVGSLRYFLGADFPGVACTEELG